MKELAADIAIIGGGLGGVAAALAALRSGRSVVMTEEYDWIGGQMTSQAVPPDEHSWVEQFGITRSYRQLRNGIRQYYRDHYPLTEKSRRWTDLNPGAGYVSRLCHEPRVGLAVMEAMLAPYLGGGRLTILQPCKPVSAETVGDRVLSVTLSHRDGRSFVVSAPFIIDGTELGDLLPMTGTEYVTGFEAQSETGEPSAPPEAQPTNAQAVSICFAIDHVEGNHVIDKPRDYDKWRAVQPHFWGGPLIGFVAPHPHTLEPMTRIFTPNPDDDPTLIDADQRRNPGSRNLWTFRRIAARKIFEPGAYPSDICLVNWPMIDYFEHPIIDVTEAEYAARLQAAADLSYSVFYWLQTEAPRADGGQGFPGLRLRGDVTGTGPDGLAMAPYIRESRRIRAVTTIVEQDLSYATRGEAGAVNYRDSVGIGMYRIDLHPSTGGDNYIDVASCPFEIPLGALLPRRMSNLLPAGKTIGTTHITNGCYRLHPIEWNIGEVAGLLAAHCLEHGLTPHQVQADDGLLSDFQTRLQREGIEIRWPDVRGY